MKVTVGYINAWRHAVFFAMIGGIILFGLCSTVASAVLGGGAAANVIGVTVLIVAIILFLMVYVDKYRLFEGDGEARFENGSLIYRDKKRSFTVPFSEMKILKFEDIKTTEPGRILIAYRLVIKTDEKTFFIESDRAAGRKAEEVELYKLYQALLDMRE